jgi:hypothetical protein
MILNNNSFFSNSNLVTLSIEAVQQLFAVVVVISHGLATLRALLSAQVVGRVG